MGKGALELEKAGVLDILRGTPVKRGSGYSEEAQYYRQNPVGMSEGILSNVQT